jgi:uncharacterized repeat protein (TIGR04138 family)
MSGILIDDSILDQLRARNPRYQDSAYPFILSALHHVLEGLAEPRHISGRELTLGVRDLALIRFGPMARTVLEHWGIRSTTDVGALVFALVECGILIKQEEDRPDDFKDVFDFDEAFEADTA